MPWKCNHHFYRLLYELHHFASKVFSSSKRNHHLFNGDWLPGCIYVYIYIYMYVSTWHKLSTKRACRTPTLLKTPPYQKTTNHAAPFISLSFRSHGKSIMGWIDHCSTPTTRRFQRSILPKSSSGRHWSVEGMIWFIWSRRHRRPNYKNTHSFWRKFFRFFLKNTTDAIFAEQKMTNV